MINIAIAFDAGMALPAIALVRSIRRFHEPQEVVLHVGSAGLPTDISEIVRAELAETGFAVRNYKMGSTFAGLTGKSHLPEAAFYRCQLLDEVEATRCLYLDSDILVRARLDKLYRWDLRDCILGAVEGCLTNTTLQFRGRDVTGPEYLRVALSMRSDWSINSGVLVVDTGRWRDADMTARIARFCADNPDIILVEQDALNALLEGQIAMIDPLWNVFPTLAYLPVNQATKDRLGIPIETYLRDARIVHFVFRSKPWEPDAIPTDFDGEFWDVIKGTRAGERLEAAYMQRLAALRAAGTVGLKSGLVETATPRQKLARARRQASAFERRNFWPFLKKRWIAELLGTASRVVQRVLGPPNPLSQWLSIVSRDLYQQTVLEPGRERV